MAGDGFPGVEWIPAHAERHAVRSSRRIDAIVLHCTDGKAVDARRTARNVFAMAPEVGADGKKRSQSSHYIVGRDGTVVQCVRHKDIAYHANEENGTTIGIEHNARKPEDTTLTDIQLLEIGGAGGVAWATTGSPNEPLVHLGPLGNRPDHLALTLSPARARLGHLHARDRRRASHGAGPTVDAALDGNLEKLSVLCPYPEGHRASGDNTKGATRMAKPTFAGKPTILPLDADTFEFHVGRISGILTVDEQTFSIIEAEVTVPPSPDPVPIPFPNQFFDHPIPPPVADFILI